MYYNLQAFILKRQDYREHDLLITAYSIEKGKVHLHARGAKKIKSKLAGHLEPVSLSNLNVITGRHFGQLIGAEAVRYYPAVKNDYQKTWQALLFLDLVDQLILSGHSDRRIFSLIDKYLDFLEKNSRHYLVARVAVSFKILALLGLNPAAKSELNYHHYINFIVNNNISSIIKHPRITQQIKHIEQELNRELDIVKNL